MDQYRRDDHSSRSSYSHNARGYHGDRDRRDEDAGGRRGGHSSDFRKSVNRGRHSESEASRGGRGYVDLDRPMPTAEDLEEKYRGKAKKPVEVVLAKPAPPDAADRFTDFSMPAMKVIDDATYKKRVQEEIDAIQKQKEEEENLDKISEQRRARLASLTASSAPSSTSSQPKPLITSNNTRSTSTEAMPTSQSSLFVEVPKAIVKTSQMALKPVNDDDDMFAEDFCDEAVEKKQGGEKSAFGSSNGDGNGNVEKSGERKVTGVELAGGGKANDDDEGYYDFRVGELIGSGKYEVLGYYGKGVYSSVIRARRVNSEEIEGSSSKKSDSAGNSKSNSNSTSNPTSNSSQNPTSNSTNPELAIKLLRNNAHMKRSGKKEVKVLKRLEEVAEAKGMVNWCLKLVEHFEEHGHVCLVFEAMDMNLTEVVKMYGHHVGLSIEAVRSYAFKMLKALFLMKQADLIHADIKPDNILVSKDRKEVKLGDFGTAFESQEAEETNQLVSRYYRAPEVIIGLFPHSFPIDMFSIGCCLYEIATGKYLLPSTNDNHHLKLIMEISGPFPKKLLLQSNPLYASQHFSLSTTENEVKFLEHFQDPLNPLNSLHRLLPMPSKPSRSILSELLQSYQSSSLTPTQLAWVQRLANLITQCLIIDPKRRITPEAALQHDLF